MGWSSGYTVQSVLLQLQSFLLELDDIPPTDSGYNTIANAKKSIKFADQFKCPIKDCSHSGRIGCFPKFNPVESNLDEFKIAIDDNELFEKELICYHTKLTYKETQLGTGLKVKKVPRTGAIS